jgi:hypothetical protein
LFGWFLSIRGGDESLTGNARSREKVCVFEWPRLQWSRLGESCDVGEGSTNLAIPSGSVKHFPISILKSCEFPDAESIQSNGFDTFGHWLQVSGNKLYVEIAEGLGNWGGCFRKLGCDFLCDLNLGNWYWLVPFRFGIFRSAIPNTQALAALIQGFGIQSLRQSLTSELVFACAILAKIKPPLLGV